MSAASLTTGPGRPGRAAAGPDPARPVLIAAGLIAAAVAAAYAANLADLRARWDSDPNYSYGYFVVPIAALILWMRRGELAATRPEPAWWGWLLLVGVLGLRAYLFELNERWSESFTLPLAAAAAVLAVGGPLMLWRAAPALAFLWFMMPLPEEVNGLLAQQLQRGATIASTAVLHLLGLPVVAEGNVILVGRHPLEVARACSGLSMLLAFVTLITATVLTAARDRPTWERAALFVSAFPIAVVCNVIRIVVTALCYHARGTTKFGPWIDFHDVAGWLMMAPALALIWAEMKLLAWLIIEEQPAAAGPMVFVTSAPRGGPRPIKK